MTPETQFSYTYMQQARDGVVEHHYNSNSSWQRNLAALRHWIAQQGLEHGRVLEVGCGTGRLQYEVANYVGIDLATFNASYLTQPFCACSAAAMPFPDNTFDGAWSIWVLEHIEQTQAVLEEMRRVVRPGGSIFLCIAYSVAPWISQGLHKRPFSDLTWSQRLVKLTIPLRSSMLYKVTTRLLRRFGLLVEWRLRRRPTRLHTTPLHPNFETYWDYDADACVSIDAYDVALFFLSRGDEPVFPAGPVRSLLQTSQPQAYVVRPVTEQSLS